MTAPATNFVVTPGDSPEVLFKQLPAEYDDSMLRRRQQEITAYQLLQAHAPEIIPEVTLPGDNPEEPLALQRLHGLGTVPAKDMLETVFAMQDWVPAPVPDGKSTLPVMEPLDYFYESISRSRSLLVAGMVRGLTAHEAAPLLERLRDLGGSLQPYDTTLVHTDAQRRHFGWAYDADDERTPRIFDFDQAHFGLELEDPVWLATRHPQLRQFVTRALQARFDGEEMVAKRENLPAAMEFFRTYFLIKGMYDRYQQSRGTLFDHASSLAGRVLVQSTTAQRLSERIDAIVSGIVVPDDSSRH
jgi:hypothetical protein